MPNDDNGLTRSSRLMIDKLGAIPKSRLGKPIGQVEPGDLARLDRALIVFLGIAGAIFTPAGDE
jgi:mRNA interferase MazF